MNKINKEIFINFSIIVLFPLFFALLYVLFIIPNYQFDYLGEVYLFYFGGISINIILNMFFIMGNGISLWIVKLIFILIFKLLLVTYYVKRLFNKPNKIKYIISVIISIIGILTGFIYEGMLTSI